MKLFSKAVILTLFLTPELSVAFLKGRRLTTTSSSTIIHHYHASCTNKKLERTRLYGALNKKNKQADLLRKAAEAKANRLQNTVEGEELSREQVKQQNDRKRFDDLLNRESVTSSLLSDSYRTNQQEEEDAMAGFRGVDRIFEGDDMPNYSVFQHLVAPAPVGEGTALNDAQVKKLLPWLRKNGDTKDYVICISDPRVKSPQFRRVIRELLLNDGGGSSVVNAEIRKRIIAINADSSLDNYKFIKKTLGNNNNNNQSSIADHIRIYSDEKREWMREFTALGENRWAICVFILQNNIVQCVIRDLDPDFASEAIINAVNSLA